MCFLKGRSLHLREAYQPLTPPSSRIAQIPQGGPLFPPLLAQPNIWCFGSQRVIHRLSTTRRAFLAGNRRFNKRNPQIRHGFSSPYFCVCCIAAYRDNRVLCLTLRIRKEPTIPRFPMSYPQGCPGPGIPCAPRYGGPSGRDRHTLMISTILSGVAASSTRLGPIGKRRSIVRAARTRSGPLRQ